MKRAITRGSEGGTSTNRFDRSSQERVTNLLFSSSLSGKSDKRTLADVSQQIKNSMPAAVQQAMGRGHKREWVENFTELKFNEKFTVLVVDDMPDQVKNVCELLECYANVETDPSYNGLDALRKVRQKMDKGQTYHLILMDLTMPYDGYETTKDIRNDEKVRKTTPPIMVLGLTGETNTAAIDERIMKAGIDGVMQKPMTLPRIKEIIEKRCKKLNIPNTFTNLKGN